MIVVDKEKRKKLLGAWTIECTRDAFGVDDLNDAEGIERNLRKLGTWDALMEISRGTGESHGKQ